MLDARVGARRGLKLTERNVFSAFRGGWRGEWRQDGRSVLADHHWHAPAALHDDPDVFVQAVVMGEWDPDTGGRKRNTVAVNAVSYATGRILGAVGWTGERAARPHVGFYVDARTLLWVVLEEHNLRFPYYSVYWERTDGGAYTIAGVGFTWDARDGLVLTSTRKAGDYRAHTLGESALEAVPTRLPGRLDSTLPNPSPTVVRP